MFIRIALLFFLGFASGQVALAAQEPGGGGDAPADSPQDAPYLALPRGLLSEPRPIGSLPQLPPAPPALLFAESPRTHWRTRLVKLRLDSLAETASPSSSLDSDPSPRPSDYRGTKFQWRGALEQSLFFLALQHGFRFATQPHTRDEIRGPFFKEWFRSVYNLEGWDDGDRFLINYIGHSMMGAVSGFIQIQNDPSGRALVFANNRHYWKSRSKAMLWSAVYSVQFELGPISEASLGNVGLAPDTSDHPMAAVDLVVTPTLGTAWLIGEDMLDRYFVEPCVDRISNRFLRLVMRSFLNPSRSFANMMRLRYPWHRDSRDPDPSR